MGILGKAFEFTADEEQLRPARKVRVGLIQNAIVLPTTKPFAEQKTAIMERITALISAAAGAGVNIICLQVSLYHRMPYFSTLVFRDLLMKWVFAIEGNLSHDGHCKLVGTTGSMDNAICILYKGENLVWVCRDCKDRGIDTSDATTCPQAQHGYSELYFGAGRGSWEHPLEHCSCYW